MSGRMSSIDFDRDADMSTLYDTVTDEDNPNPLFETGDEFSGFVYDFDMSFAANAEDTLSVQIWFAISDEKTLKYTAEHSPHNRDVVVDAVFGGKTDCMKDVIGNEFTVRRDNESWALVLDTRMKKKTIPLEESVVSDASAGGLQTRDIDSIESTYECVFNAPETGQEGKARIIDFYAIESAGHITQELEMGIFVMLPNGQH